MRNLPAQSSGCFWIWCRTSPLRLNKATEFLAQTDVPISEIAERTGFGNSNYFYTVFKRHYAVTPSEYRANRLNRADTKEAYNNEIN